MRAIKRFLLFPVISSLLFACGGDPSVPTPPPVVSPPGEPTVTVDADIKQLIFRWDAVADATYYRLLENPDGHSGFTQVGDNIPAATLTASRDVAVHLFDWVNAQYMVEACNVAGCSSSEIITATDVMLDTIGYFKESDVDRRGHFGWAVALSADGNTLAVGAKQEDSSATGINSDRSDNSLEDSGAVYPY